MRLSTILLFSCLVACALAACPFHASGQDDGVACPHKLPTSSHRTEITNNNCKCKTTCHATVGNGAAKCDYCETEAGCGIRGPLGGWYDYCTYPEDKSYESQSASEKLDWLWTQVKANRTSGTYPNVLGIIGESVATSFENFRDVMPEGRQKYIHSVGAVCKFSMTMSDDSPYTGVFTKGTTVTGLVRLGSATPVTETSGVTPGLGIKFMRTGVESGNFVALYDLNPLPDTSYNFFQETFSNHLPAPSGATAVLAKKFNQVSQCATMVGMSDICNAKVDGTPSANPVFPFEIRLKSEHVQFPKDPMTLEQLQAKLEAIPKGTDLFTVTTIRNPNESPEPLGIMKTTSECVNSNFGDTSLFFRHQLVEQDWQLRPDWLSKIDPANDCGASKLTPDGAPKPCTNC